MEALANDERYFVVNWELQNILTHNRYFALFLWLLLVILRELTAVHHRWTAWNVKVRKSFTKKLQLCCPAAEKISWHEIIQHSLIRLDVSQSAKIKSHYIERSDFFFSFLLGSNIFRYIISVTLQLRKYQMPLQNQVIGGKCEKNVQL